MTDTPIVDAAIRAGCEARYCIYPTCIHSNPACQRHLVTLRAALPWDPTAEAVAAIASIIARVAKNHAALFSSEAIAAYRAQPIMRELYPEKFT